MFASIFISVASLIALQVVFVIKAADWLSPNANRPQTDSVGFIDRSAGRFTGIA